MDSVGGICVGYPQLNLGVSSSIIAVLHMNSGKLFRNEGRNS